MNNNSSQIEQLNQEQMRINKEMTELINKACKNNDLHKVGEILKEYKLKLATIKEEINEISRESGLNNIHGNR